MKIQGALSLLVALAAVMSSCGETRAAAQDQTSLNPLRRIEKATLKNFLERPLLDPSRRPPPAAISHLLAVRAPAYEEPPPTMTLLGVVHGIRDMAIARRLGEKKTTILRSGDYVDAWSVTVVPPIGVRLRKGNRVFEYALFANLNRSAGPVALAPPVATGPVDAVGMPTVMPSSWGMAPN